MTKRAKTSAIFSISFSQGPGAKHAEPTVYITAAPEYEGEALAHELAAALIRHKKQYGAPIVSKCRIAIRTSDRALNGAASKLLANVVKETFGKIPSAPKLNRPEPGEVPKPGQHIYVPTAMYLDHGEDDFDGGIATIKRVEQEGRYTYVVIEEHPGTSYNWSALAQRQSDFEKEYGDQWSHPSPDV
jgi:hypothetical protein